MISYGADPTGKLDSTDAILKAMEDAFDGPNHGVLMQGINDLGGARIDLQGGSYLISRPLRFPSAGVGNLLVSISYFPISLFVKLYILNLFIASFQIELDFYPTCDLIYRQKSRSYKTVFMARLCDVI